MIIWIICGFFVENCSVFSSRLFELFQVESNYLDYLYFSDYLRLLQKKINGLLVLDDLWII